AVMGRVPGHGWHPHAPSVTLSEPDRTTGFGRGVPIAVAVAVAVAVTVIIALPDCHQEADGNPQGERQPLASEYQGRRILKRCASAASRRSRPRARRWAPVGCGAGGS